MISKERPVCAFCDEIDDVTLLHFFVYCDNVGGIWKDFLFGGTASVISLWTSQRATVKKYIVFGLPNKSDNQIVLNFCILHMKNYI